MSIEQPTELPQSAPVVVEEEQLSATRATARVECRFTEVWEETWPSLQDLEDAGDSHAASARRIREHLAARSVDSDSRTASPEPTMYEHVDLTPSSSKSPGHLGPLPPPQLHFAPDSGPRSPTISSGGSSPKPSSGAFASVVRRASLLRPNAARTKSMHDAPTRPPAPLVSPALESSPQRPNWDQPTRSQSAAPEGPGLAYQLDENRAPTPASAATGAPPVRKLRKSKPPSPVVPSIRTDPDYLAASRPSYSPALVYSPSGLSPVPPPSSPTSQKRSWRRSFPLFSSSAPSTPNSEDKEAELRRRERSPSPIGAFPSEVRRAPALPPVDSRRKKRTSTVSSSDSYLGDGEGSKPVGKKVSAASSSSSSSGMWGAFKAKERKDRKGSIKSEDEWEEELLDRSTSYEGLVVLSRPPVGRSHSDPSVELEKPRKGGLAGASASSSSLNLDKIEEQPEDPTTSRQPSLRNLIAQEEHSPYSTSPPPSTFGTRTRTHSNTTASLATTSRAPSPTRIISAKSSSSALACTITPEHTAHFHPASTTRITPTPLEMSSVPSSSASDDSNPSPILEIRSHTLSSSTSTVDSSVPPTPELIRSRRGEASTASSSSLSRHALSGPSESDLSMRSGETTPWDASEGEDTQPSSAEHDEEEDEVLSISGVKQLRGSVQVRVEGEGVVGW